MSERRLQLATLAAAISNDPRRAIVGARTSSFQGIAFDAISPSLDFTELSQTGRREFRQLLASNNLALAALRVDLGIKGFAPGADIDRLLSQLQNVMDAAKAIVAPPLICLDLGPLPEPAAVAKPVLKVTSEQAGLIIIPELKAPPPPPPPGPGPDPVLLSHIDGALRELGMLADRVGVTLAFRSDLASFAALDRALTVAACPWFDVDFDPVAMLRDDWPADEIFSRLGSQIRSVRARDAVAGADRRTKPAIIGHGSIDWIRALSDLDAAGYRGWLTIDSLDLPDRLGAAVSGANHLRDLMQPT